MLMDIQLRHLCLLLNKPQKKIHRESMWKSPHHRHKIQTCVKTNIWEDIWFYIHTMFCARKLDTCQTANGRCFKERQCQLFLCKKRKLNSKWAFSLTVCQVAHLWLLNSYINERHSQWKRGLKGQRQTLLLSRRGQSAALGIVNCLPTFSNVGKSIFKVML